ncbi:Exodeoxyribonuclease I subunit D [Fictibacillus enclensis]|uniref:Nuclease SbcCD subunit D n=1 Tax=Fictibacillus enclensis TaxID=1017270 RepID=A0A0V8JCN8_9BACL|nr:exonuclease subunit SbcD [Fictibacillus enclensis]KSU84787.1 exonuclease sbcCD subunit D [Fictibacillus enclensis]SCB85731.1 Exodeoxyribonuclease I subunit D [Fictibacillus enclensis]
MRLLHTADWHLGRTLEGRSRLEEQQQFLDELVQIAEEERVDAIIMAGDVFDTVNPPAAAEQMFYDGMARLSDRGRRPVIAIAGNHDHPDRLAASSPLSGNLGITLVGLPTTQLYSYGIERTQEKLNICALPYPSESRLKEVLSDTGEELHLRNQYDNWVGQYFNRMTEWFDPQAVNIAMSHLYVAGSNESDSERPVHIGGAYTVAAETLPQKAQYVALGHLHRPQNVKRAKTAARYSGSPLSYSFSEAGHTKSVTIVDLAPGKEASIREIPLTCGHPLMVYHANGVADVHQWLDEVCPSKAWVDLSITVKDSIAMEDIQAIRKAHKGIIHIKPAFEGTREPETSVQKNLPIDELFKTFYKRQTGGGVPDENVLSLFLELISDEDEERSAAE